MTIEQANSIAEGTTLIQQHAWCRRPRPFTFVRMVNERKCLVRSLDGKSFIKQINSLTIKEGV